MDSGRAQYENALRQLRDMGLQKEDIINNYFTAAHEDLKLETIENTHPKLDDNYVIKSTVIIDSRNRDYTIYPNPAHYQISLGQVYRSVTRIELVGVMLPKTEYNVNRNNNLIPWFEPATPNTLNIGELAIGQYIIGTATAYTVPTFGLLREVTDALNASLGLRYPAEWFTASLCSLPQTTGETGTFNTPGGAGGELTVRGVNKTVNNRVLIEFWSGVSVTNPNGFTLDFSSNNSSTYKLLGFNNIQYVSGALNIIEPDGAQVYSPWLGAPDAFAPPPVGASVPPRLKAVNGVVADFDYNLHDFPDYALLNLIFSGELTGRTESNDRFIDNNFATILYDANNSDVIESFPTNIATNPTVATYNRQGANMKSLKGTDFDKKVLILNPAIDMMQQAEVNFKKYNDELYDFDGREHLLIFEFETDSNVKPQTKY